MTSRGLRSTESGQTIPDYWVRKSGIFRRNAEDYFSARQKWTISSVGNRKFLAAILLFINAVVGCPSFAQPRDLPVDAQTAAPASKTLSELINLYFAWRGGAAFEHLQSLHIRSLAGTNGQSTEDQWLDRAGYWREDYAFGGITITRVATPGRSWTVNPSGQAEDDPGASVKARRRALIEFGDALRGQDGAQVKLLGGTRRAPLGAIDRAQEPVWAVININFGDADVYDLLIDPTTGMLGFYIFEESGQTFTYEFSDWRMVEGVRLPFWTVLTADTDNRNTHVSAVEINQPMDQSLFSRPRPAPREPKSSGWVDFEMEGGQIRFPVIVNGHQVTAFLDNGASSSVIDPYFAESVGLETKGEPFSIQGASPSSVNGRWVPGTDITVGTLKMSDLTIMSMDTSFIAKVSGGAIPLILGDDALNEFVVDIDFFHNRIQFQDPAAFSPPADAFVMPLIRSGDVHSVPISIEGRQPIWVSLDLGSSDTLSVFPDYVKTENLIEGHPTSLSLFSGIGGIQTQTDVILRNLVFGSVNLNNVPASFLPERVRGTFPNTVLGSIGTQILRRYRLILDYPHNRVYVIPDPKAIDVPFDRNRLGVSWLPDGDDILIMLVAPNSPAAVAGLRVGDKISMIDGKPAKEWSSAGARAALKEGPVGRRIIFTLNSGDRKTVTLSDYY